MAISRDNNGTATSNSTTGLTTSFTVTGTNPVLIWGTSDLAATTDRINAPTYNGTTMTRINATINSGHGSQALYGLINPSTGAHNVVSSYSASILAREIFASYKNVKQSGLPDSQNTAAPGVAASPLTVSTTVVASNCWLVGYTQTDGGSAMSVGSGTSLVAALDSGYSNLVDSNGTVGTGSQSLSMTWGGGSQTSSMCMCSLAPDVNSYNLALVQGSYTLTGQSLGLLRGLRVALVQGAYALTGQNVGFLYGRIVQLAYGAYALTGQALGMVFRGWARPSKSSTSWSNGTKSSSSWSNSSKNSSSWTNQTKN